MISLMSPELWVHMMTVQNNVFHCHLIEVIYWQSTDIFLCSSLPTQMNILVCSAQISLTYRLNACSDSKQSPIIVATDLSTLGRPVKVNPTVRSNKWTVRDSNLYDESTCSLKIHTRPQLCTSLSKPKVLKVEH